MSNPPPIPARPLDYAGRRSCPGCGGGPLSQPSFTWWGGAIGHRVLGLERCDACAKWWVKKTGQPGGNRITIYVVVGTVVGLIFAILFLMSR
jgi:hypothetical protein